MKKNLFCMLALAAMIGSAGCADDPITPEKAFTGGTTVETDASWNLESWGENEFTVTVNEDYLRQIGIRQWNYRVIYDDAVQQEGTVTDAATQVKISIPANASDQKRRVKTEVRFTKPDGVTTPWTPVSDLKQPGWLVPIDGIYWATGNLTLRDGEFALAYTSDEPGLYFEHMSSYGILSDGDRYSGKCYTPEETTISLGDIPRKNGDPCRLVKGVDLRMPTLYEMRKLYDVADGQSREINGRKGFMFGGGKLFLPLAGGCDRETGAIGYKGTNGAYWYSGEDVDGNGGLLAMSDDYTMLYYNLGTNTASVRCVRNIAKAAYVSHTPQTLEGNGQVVVQVVTSPGDMDGYEVMLTDGVREIVSTVSSQNPRAELVIPENAEVDDIEYELFVNGERTGKKIVQPGVVYYATYESHTPVGPVPADAFTLRVTCRTNMDEVIVQVKCLGLPELDHPVSKDDPVATFNIPANEGDERTFEIFVDEKNTGRKVVQMAPEKGLSVIWSPGYLTVKDGAYAFAGEQELGMYFKYNSRYGLTLDATGKKYSGTAYGPAPETKAYADIAAKEVDPCSLVAPAGTWRTPTQDQWLELLACTYEWEMDKYRVFSDGQQTVYLTPSGSIKDDGASMLQPQWAKVWSSTTHVTDATKNYTMIGTFSSKTGVFGCTIGTVHNQALMVRCVRDR